MSIIRDDEPVVMFCNEAMGILYRREEPYRQLIWRCENE